MTERVARRPGPRSDVDVPRALVLTAERLFAEQGVAEVSMRAVAREAGVAPAAVTYHFPTKADLVTAILRRRTETVGGAIRDRLLALVARGADEPPVARELMAAVVEPIVDSVEGEGPTGRGWLKIFARLAQADDPIFVDQIDRSGVSEAFARAAARVVPGYREDREVRLRVGFAMFTTLYSLAGADLVGHGRPAAEELPGWYVEQLLVFTAAGIEA